MGRKPKKKTRRDDRTKNAFRLKILFKSECHSKKLRRGTPLEGGEKKRKKERRRLSERTEFPEYSSRIIKLQLVQLYYYHLKATKPRR